jgi:spermidine/putrescine transport system substrate-binding protein
MSRRQFMTRAAAAGIAVPSMAAFLDACAKASSSTPSTGLPFPIAAPHSPVKWPIHSDNKPTKSGLTPEQGAVVKIYTYTDYVADDALKSFAAKYKQYGVTAAITTFEDTTEALGKLRSGAVQVDIFNPSYDQLGELVYGEVVRPLNHSYIPNITNVWPQFQNPFYDQEWRYTIPYTVYTTGIAWRTDKVALDVPSMPNPYDALWDTTYAHTTSPTTRTCRPVW